MPCFCEASHLKQNTLRTKSWEALSSPCSCPALLTKQVSHSNPLISHLSWFHSWGLWQSSSQALRSCIPSFCPSQGCHTWNKIKSPLPHPVLKVGIQEALQRWHLTVPPKMPCLPRYISSTVRRAVPGSTSVSSTFSSSHLSHPYSRSLQICICCKITSMAMMQKIYPATTSLDSIPIADKTSIFYKYLSANTTGFQFICLQKIAVSISTNSKTFWTASVLITLWCWVIPTLTYHTNHNLKHWISTQGMDNLALSPTPVLVMQQNSFLHLFTFPFSALYSLCLQVCSVGKREETGMLWDDSKEKGAKRKKRLINMEKINWTQ